MIINFKVIYCKQAVYPIAGANYGCFPYQYCNVLYMKVKEGIRLKLLKVILLM
jgi:hypothetical protein